MNRKIVAYGLAPFLFGFLLLGAMGQARGRHDQGPHAAAPARPPAQAPLLHRALEQHSEAATLAPLPVFVPEPDDADCSGARVCHWST
jgi:hypothetical protein